jgi:sugar lactone lactonase YvrE
MSVLRSVMTGWIALAGAVLACTAPNPAYHADRTSGPDAGEEEVDAGPDIGPALRVPGDAAAPDVGTSSAVCGTARPPLDQLVAVDSLAIDGSGNIYFSNDDGTNAWVGKLAPDGTLEKHWLTIPVGPPTRGMAIDDARGVIYFTTGAGAPELEAADLGDAPVARMVYRGFTDPNDVAMGFDGDVYVSDQGDGQIYGITPATKKRTKITTMPIGIASMGSGPAGLAFDPDHTLVVGYKGSGQLIRIRMDKGVESGRSTFGPLNDWVNALAYDDRGRLYLALFDLNAFRDVVRLDGDNASPVPIASGGHFSAMAFGRGALDCTDLYVADPAAGAAVRRFSTQYAGLSVP